MEKIKIMSAIDEELIIDYSNDNEYDKFNKKFSFLIFMDLIVYDMF